jgi:hypothetical protein
MTNSNFSSLVFGTMGSEDMTLEARQESLTKWYKDGVEQTELTPHTKEDYGSET